MNKSEERKGEIYMILVSVLEALFPIFSLFSIVLVGAIYSYLFSIIIAGIIFSTLVIYKKTFYEIKNPEARKDLLLTAFFINTLFVLVFLGLQYTTAGNMAVIIFLQVLFAYLYFNVIGKEALSKMHTIGAVIMGIGAIDILLPESMELNKGDLIILLASALAPFANLYQKRARKFASAYSILAFRNVIAIPFIFIIAYMSETMPSIDNIVLASPYLLGIGVLVLGVSKVLYIEALHRIAITKISALLALIPLFTIVFAYLILDEVPSFRQLLGIIPIIIGGYLITKPEVKT